MKSRTLIATIGTVAALCIVGWMIYDGTQVAEVKTARVKLQPDQPASTVQKNTAAKVQAQPIVSNAVPSSHVYFSYKLGKVNTTSGLS